MLILPARQVLRDRPLYSQPRPPSLLCLGEPPPDMLPSALSAQVVSALSSLKKGRRDPGTRSGVSCRSGSLGAEKKALSAELHPNSDPDTILQTQDCLRRDYEALQVLAKVTLLF